MIEKTFMYKHNNTPALNTTGPDQQYLLAVLFHIVTKLFKNLFFFFLGISPRIIGNLSGRFVFIEIFSIEVTQADIHTDTKVVIQSFLENVFPLNSMLFLTRFVKNAALNF